MKKVSIKYLTKLGFPIIVDSGYDKENDIYFVAMN